MFVREAFEKWRGATARSKLLSKMASPLRDTLIQRRDKTSDGRFRLHTLRLDSQAGAGRRPISTA